MSTRNCLVGVLALLLVSAGRHADACGYDGLGADLSLAHPDSLQVSLAVYQAYQSKLLTRLLPLPGGFGMRRAQVALHRLGESLPDAAGSFDLLLLEPGLWVHFAAHQGVWQLTLHSPAPAAGQPVVIIGEGALLAMVAGKLSAAQALDAGLLQLDPDPRQVQRWQAAFGAP